MQAAREHRLDLSCSFTIGDKEWDVSAGKAAGTRTILLQKGTPRNAWEDTVTRADFVASSLIDAANLILYEQSQVKGCANDQQAHGSRWKTS
jgi:histidinol phosphatase-like enzyme